MKTAAREGDIADIWDIRGTGFMEDGKYPIHYKTKEEKNGWLHIKVNTGKYGQEVEDTS